MPICAYSSLGKNISFLAASASRAAIHKSFALQENLAGELNIDDDDDIHDRIDNYHHIALLIIILFSLRCTLLSMRRTVMIMMVIFNYYLGIDNDYDGVDVGSNGIAW